MGINISDYNRAGIFMDERNASTIDTPAVQEGTFKFIPGFSRRGTVFNRPVLLNSKNDRALKFGEIDRYLEKRGSYFHRTIDIALQSGPVYALNLLKTSSLDTLDYVSMSLAAQYDNEDVTQRQYDDFFNKSGFWQRDTESFLYFASDNEKMIHFTNVSDKNITFFMFKADAPNYDITAEVWYKGADKVPTWMDKNALISDYMVRVIVVSGDWSNYPTLAADTNWSKYFDASGLRKTKANDFVRDNAVTLLGDYTGSVIPYFRDDNTNTNLFIETLINIDTDKSGLFCSFDIDKVETDFKTGRIDLIGETLVGSDMNKINFMSYTESIEELDVYDEMSNLQYGNVSAIESVVTANTLYNDKVAIDFGAFTIAPTDITVNYSGPTPFIVLNGLEVPMTTPDATVLPLPVIASPITAGNSNYTITLVYVDSMGQVKTLNGNATEALSGNTVPTSISGLQFPASYPNDSVILFYVLNEFDGTTTTQTFFNVTIDNAGTLLPVTIGTNNTFDVTITMNGVNDKTLVFNGTANITKANYEKWRVLEYFNNIVTKLVQSESVILDVNGDKVLLTNATISDNYSSGTGDKYIQIIVDSSIDISQTSFILFYKDLEFHGGINGVETKTAAPTPGYGTVSRHSEFYLDYYNGMINTGDYFYVRLAQNIPVRFIKYTDLSNPTAIGNYLVLQSTDANNLGLAVNGANNAKYLIKHSVNNGMFTLHDSEDNTGLVFGSLIGLNAGEVAFILDENVNNGGLENHDIFDVNQKVYLKMYTLGDILKVDYTADNTLTTPYVLPGSLLNDNKTIFVYSGESSYEQTLEIEQNSSYTITDNKVLIDSVRYAEVKVGDYVKAYYDVNTLQPGEEPKKFARILKKTPWSGNVANNVQYSEITTDIKIDVQDYNGDLQTTRYTTIEDYISTYKATVLKGFTPQTTSIPNGTETRQSEILDIIGKTTPLYGAIINKRKFNFRYLVDSFGNGLTEFSKQQLADITGKRKNCLAILNMPSKKQFVQSQNPSFINDDGTLNFEYVKLGGNPQQNPNFLYSLADGSGSDDGRDASAYFFPYCKISDNGRPLYFPPAAFVSNAYMRKIDSNIAGVYNWTVAAGIEDGIIKGIADTEIDFTDTDYSELYQMGVNPISYDKKYGFYIETEFTASRKPLSSLSFIHVREILIDLENELYAMLLKYQWKFNTPSIRAKIKREADDICQSYVDKGALYVFKNVIDETNNTNVIIDNQMGLLETYIEVVKSMGIIVNVINAMATGALGNSTGFTAQ